jgi:hypothetical protein
MRKVLIILLAVFLFSCNKDPDCYKCTTKITVTIKEGEESNSWSVSDTRSKCDLTENAIREYEINNTGSVTYINGGVRIDTVTITFCTK